MLKLDGKGIKLEGEQHSLKTFFEKIYFFGEYNSCIFMLFIVYFEKKNDEEN